MNHRTLRLSRRSIPVLIYTKLWGFKVEDANFCALFWATLLLPVGLYIWFVGKFLPKSVAKGYRLATRQRALDGAERAGNRIGTFIDDHGDTIALMLGVAAVIGLVGILVVWALNNFESFWIVWVGILLGATLLWLASKTPLARFLLTGVRAVKSRTCPRVEIEP